ncbi:hypothetical protein M4951_15350 [Blastopirellula sp. J2-11]|uniref:hypothetical protein n=1 Tax=Blastopirellula sp. J2-11 TaxID=2943192 RepID=UPI0021C96E47|nr:hypothetical protein [Blastopirellula sp. J2-11]UUO04762.1 hypothetical protein M4951_15350 [Blastopirellula sp. J2-11]
MEQASNAANKKVAAKRFLLIAVIALVPILLLLLRYRSHLAWKVMEHQLELRDAFESPTRLMPLATIPTQWRKTKAAGLNLALPSDMTQIPLEDIEALLFENEELRVFIFPRLPITAGDQAYLQKATEFSPTQREFTWPSLRFEIFQKNVDDFRWSMTNKEVLWHFYCMNIRCDQPGQKVEGFFTNDLDGLLVTENNTASFDWQSNLKPYDGLLQFASKQGELNLDHVRAICHSIELDDND